jgi:hypothetical protein
LNEQWRELKLRKTIKRCLLDVGLMHYAVAVPHYYTLFRGDEIVQEGLAVNRVLPTDFWWDFDAINPPEDALYYIRRSWLPIDLAYEMYPQVDWKPVQRFVWETENKDKTVNQQDTEDLKYPNREFSRVAVFEAQDLREGKIIRFCEEHDDLLDEIDFPYSNIKGFLPEYLCFNEVPDETYPEADVAFVEPQQLEVNKIRTQAMIHRKRFNRRYIALKDAIDDEQMEVLKAGEDGTIAMVNDLDGIKPLEDAPLDPHIYTFHEPSVKEDFREISGINEYLRAGAVPRVKTAYETAEIIAGGTIRIADRADEVEDFVRGIARKLLQIGQEYYDKPIIARIPGFGIQEFTRDWLQGDFNIVIKVGSTRPVDLVREVQLAGMIYDRLAQDPSVRNRTRMIQDLLAKIDPTLEFEEWFQPPPNPMEAQSQVLANLLRQERR